MDFLISKNKDRHKEFYHIITHLEDIAILQIVQNSEEWFGAKIPRNQVELMFKSSIHRPLEMDDPFIFKVNKISTLGSIEHNFPVACLIKVDGIIFGKNSSILDMKVVQVRISKPEKIPSVPSTGEHPMQQIQKPFYSDNASVVPSNYSKTDFKTPDLNKLPSVKDEDEDEDETNEMNK